MLFHDLAEHSHLSIRVVCCRTGEFTLYSERFGRVQKPRLRLPPVWQVNIRGHENVAFVLLVVRLRAGNQRYADENKNGYHCGSVSSHWSSPFALDLAAKTDWKSTFSCKRINAVLANLALSSGSGRLPDFTQFFAAREDMCFCVVKAGVDVRALNGVAGRAASHKIAGILLSFAGARNHEIDAHDQRVFKTCTPIQTTISTNITISFENLAAFSNGYRGIHERKR